MSSYVRAAVFSGETFVKFLSGPPSQLNANLGSGGVDDWRPVDVTVRDSGSVGSRTALPVHPEFSQD